MSAAEEIAAVLEGRKRWCVIHEDNAEILPLLPDKSVAHVITDPPYGEHVYAKTRTNKGSGFLNNGTPIHGDNGTSKFEMAAKRIGTIDDILESVAAQIVRVPTRWMLVFSCMETTHRWRASMGSLYVRTGAWVKTNPMPQVSGDRPAMGFEPCTIGHAPGRKKWNGGGKAATWSFSNEDPNERPDHPCPKPLPLMRELVELFTDPDDVILDPFCGSGTTGVAALRLGRRAILIEKDEKYAAIARDRMTAESRGQSLREFRAGQGSLFGEAK